MLEKYYMYKVKYKDYILLIKSGNFYEIIGKDALILNSIFKYKITRLSNTLKCGFPISSINKVINKLNELKINYLVISDTLNEKSFDDNKYNYYNFDVDSVIYNYIRIEKITKYLNDNVLNSSINDVLDGIEKIL